MNKQKLQLVKAVKLSSNTYAAVITAGAVGTAIKHTAVGTAKVVHDVLSDNPQSDNPQSDASNSEQQ